MRVHAYVVMFLFILRLRDKELRINKNLQLVTNLSKVNSVIINYVQIYFNCFGGNKQNYFLKIYIT